MPWTNKSQYTPTPITDVIVIPEKTSLPKDKMAIYMVVHIFIALISTLVWGYHTIRSFKEFVETKSVYQNHKKVGRLIFAGMTITSVMGVGVYWLLFVQGIS